MTAAKIKRALRLSAVCAYPGTAQAMLDIIPPAVAEALTAAQIGTLLDAMWAGCQTAKSLALADAVREGAVWDARTQCLREIAHAA